MSKANGAHILKLFRDIGIHFTDRETFLEKTSKCSEIKHVSNDGEYSVYYKELAEDQEVYEMKGRHDKKEVDFRLFFFTIQPERTFYVLSAQGGIHHDTSKSKFRD